MRGEKGENIHDAQSAHPADGNEHGQHRMPDAAHRPDQHFHNAAQAVGGADDGDALHAEADHLVRLCVDGKEKRSRKECRKADRKPDGGNDEQTVEQHRVDVFLIPRAEILPRKGQARLRYGVHAGVHEPFDVRSDPHWR